MEDSDPINSSGQFVYFSIIGNLQKIIDEEFYQDNVIRLLINVDGMPLSISGSKSILAILCKIYYRFDVYTDHLLLLFIMEKVNQNSSKNILKHL